MKTVKAIIKITRPINCAITFITIVAACFVSSDSPDITVVFLAAFAGALVNAGGNVINDYFDVENDKLNRPERPLPAGEISKSTVFKIYFLSVIFAFVLAYKINSVALIIVITTTLLLFVYSYKLKGLALAGNLIVAFSAGLAFLFGSVAVGNFRAGIIPAIFAFLISLMREIVKDIEDLKGDKEIGLSTFPIVFGVDKSVQLITVVGLLLITSTIIPYLLGIYNFYYLIVVMSVNAIVLLVLKILRDEISAATLKKASGLLKLGMALGITAIFIGVKL